MSQQDDIDQSNAPGGLLREGEMFFPLAVPMAVARLALAGLCMVDGAVLAQMGSRELARWGLAWSVVGPLWMLGLVAVLAGGVFAARARAGSVSDRVEVGRIWQLSLVIAAAIGLVGALLATLWPTVMGLSSSPGGLGTFSGPVAAVMSLSLLPGLLAVACADTLVSTDNGRMVVLAAVLAHVLNLALLLRLGGTLDSGLAPAAVHAAWTVAMVRLALAAVLLAGVWWLPRRKMFGLTRSWAAGDWRRGADQRRRAVDSAAGMVVPAGLAFGLGLLAAWMGEVPMAALTGLCVLLTPAMVLGWSLAEAGALRVAAMRLQGQRRPNALARCAGRCAVLLTGLLVLLSLLYAAAPRDLVQAVLVQPEVVETVLRVLPVGLGLVLIESLSMLFAGGLRSLGERRLPLVWQASTAALTLPLAWGLAQAAQLGVLGLLLAFGLAALLRAWALFAAYRDRAGDLDSANADALRRHAKEIANGWADTVMMMPSPADMDEIAAGGVRSRRAARSQ